MSNSNLKHCVSCDIIMGKLISVSGEVPWHRTELDSGNGQCTDCIENGVEKPEGCAPKPVVVVDMGAFCEDCGVPVTGKNKRCEEHQRLRRLAQSRKQGEMRRRRKGIKEARTKDWGL